MTREPNARKTKPPARAHPDDRDRIAALKALGGLIDGKKKVEPLSYYTPILIQCTLPHSDPKTHYWARTNGEFSLLIASGVDCEGMAYGVPYGSFPRLVLSHIITQVIRTKERRVDLGASLSGFLHEIGYTGNFRGSTTRAARTVREQLLRLIKASIQFERRQGTDADGRLAGMNINIASKYALWWDFRQPEQDSLWGSYIDISEEFREAILNAPVPLRSDVLKDLHKSPLALDVYMWVSYRLFTMRASGEESVTLSYGRLQEQFGTGIAEENYRMFRLRFKQAFGKVANYWRDENGKTLLHHEFDTIGLTLYRSPFIVGKAKAATGEDAASAVLVSRSFDQETRRAARQISGNWDLAYLESQYFDWIEKEGITPKSPRAHFLDFIKTHRQRHRESL